MRTDRLVRMIPYGMLQLALVFLPQASSAQEPDLGVAQYTVGGELVYPDNTDEWILMGASLGGDYSEEAISTENPGQFGIVQMEPKAYRYFLEHKEYADGTMLLLVFHGSERKSEPQLRGFVQGEVEGREIHVIDRQRFEDGRAFFFYRANVNTTAMIPPGNECVACHVQHGQYDGTFTQFYPAVRHLIETD